MRVSQNSPALRVCALVAMLLVSLSTAAFAEDDWRLYTSPQGEFKMMAPGPVTVEHQKLGGQLDADNYQASGDQTRTCLVACELQNDKAVFERFAEGAKTSITGKGGKINETRDVTGPGWSGHLYDYSVPGEKPSSLLVAKVDDSGVYYTIAMNARSDGAEGKSLYDSFEVTPSAVASSSTSKGATSGEESEARKAGREFGKNMVYGVGAIVLIIIVLGVISVPILGLIVFLYVMNQRKKNNPPS